METENTAKSISKEDLNNRINKLEQLVCELKSSIDTKLAENSQEFTTAVR